MPPIDFNPRQRLLVAAFLLLALGGLWLTIATTARNREGGAAACDDRRSSLPPDDLLLRRILAAEPLPGDLVFRRGRGWMSQAVRAFDRATTYSHVGMIVRQSDGVLAVAHSLPSDPTVAGSSSGTRIEAIGSFLASENASMAALFRPRGTSARHADAAAQAAIRLARPRRPFDSSFDLSDRTAVYCTELVWAAYLETGIDVAKGRLEALQLPFFRHPVLAPSTLTRNPSFRRLAYTNLKENPRCDTAR